MFLKELLKVFNWLNMDNFSKQPDECNADKSLKDAKSITDCKWFLKLLPLVTQINLHLHI